MIDRARGEKCPRFLTLAILAAGLVGCAISFDGYELESEGGVASGSATGGAGNALTGAAGVSTEFGGSAMAGNGGGAGDTVASGGNGGVVGAGGAMSPDASAGSAGAAVDAGKAGAAGAGGSVGMDAGPGCPVAGAPMTEVPIPMGAPGYPGTYCIDRTEVTNKQYADFLATNPSPVFQPSYCTWNNTFAPQSSAGVSNCENVALVYDPGNHPLNPVACIDWCDAFAYCKSVGKRLCGAFGGGGVAQGEGANSKTDEWVNACSAGGTKAYPYGATYQGSACNGLDYIGNPAGSIQVGGAVNCVGGYNGIFDMSGNVAEWEDACNASTGSSDLCPVRGGYYQSYDSPGNSAACAAAPSTSRSRISRQIGFRCCYDGK